jgi:UrcA family protein
MMSLRLPPTFAIGSCVFVLSSLLVTPRVVYAESSAVLPTRIVRFADLNPNTRAGIEVLYRRIHSAARDVCEPAQDPGSRHPSAAWQSCVRKAVLTAVQNVDRPLLTAYFEERDGSGSRRIPPSRTADRGADR